MLTALILVGLDGYCWISFPRNFIKLAETSYLDHFSSVFLFPLRVYKRNWPLWIGCCQFLNTSFYWSPDTIESLSSLEQVKQLLLAPGSDPDQETKESSSSLYNPLHRGEYILSPYPSTLSDHFTTTMVDVPASGAWLLIIAPYLAKSSICVYCCFSCSEKKPQSGWLPLGDNHYSKYWWSCPWSWNLSRIRFGSFNYLLN